MQLLEAGLNFCLFLFLHRALVKGRLRGHLLQIYLIAYSCCRFGLEFLRGDVYRGMLLGLSTSQWLALLILLGAGISLLLDFQKSRKNAAPTEAA